MHMNIDIMICSHAGDGDEREHPARPVQPAYAAHLSLGLPRQSKTYCNAIGYPYNFGDPFFTTTCSINPGHKNQPILAPQALNCPGCRALAKAVKAVAAVSSLQKLWLRRLKGKQYFWTIISSAVAILLVDHAVDGGNPAPVNRWFIPL